MSEFWRRWKQPWTRSQITRRYIESNDNIGIRRLAQDSGVSKGTIEIWCRQENWVGQKRRYSDGLQTATRDKAIEKTAEKLSDELSDVAIANYQAHKLARDYATAVFQIKAMHMQSILDTGASQQSELLKFHNAHEMNSWSLILTRATEGINQATGLPCHININTAAKTLNSAGYSVTELRQET